MSDHELILSLADKLATCSATITALCERRKILRMEPPALLALVAAIAVGCFILGLLAGLWLARVQAREPDDAEVNARRLCELIEERNGLSRQLSASTDFVRDLRARDREKSGRIAAAVEALTGKQETPAATAPPAIHEGPSELV